MKSRAMSGAVVLLLASLAVAQEGGSAAPPEGGTLPGGPPKTNPASVPGPREVVFQAPTEEDWKRPVVLTWQRTWEDALAVSKETGRPILVCVNMDGEIASEHYAGLRYRDPATAAIYAPYVTVIASVYTHNPKDYDEAGRRIPCPRFGGVTCGEHVAIEPVLYAKYFDGQRIAPRHVCIDVNGKETFDVFYANDIGSVFQTITDGPVSRDGAPPPVVRGDRPVTERVASREVSDRVAVESAYRAGDEATRRALLEAAAKHPEAVPLDLLRQAIFGLDPAMAKLARNALARLAAPDAAVLMGDALRAPMDPAEREALLAALARIGQGSPRAKWLAAVHTGVGGTSTAIDVGGWVRAGAEYPAAPPATAAAKAGTGAEPATVAGTPSAEAEALLAAAEASLDGAMEARMESDAGRSRSGRMLVDLQFEDALRTARRAEEAGARGWRVDSVLAIAAYYSGSAEEAYARAEAAAKAIPPGDPSWNSMATLTIFAEGRWKAIQAAMAAKKEWPPRWLTDLHSVYTVLLHHPRVTDDRIAWHAALLEWLRLADREAKVLAEGLERFPESEMLHERFRRRLLADRGPEGLEAVYAGRLKGRDRLAAEQSFAARASLAAAEEFRRTRRAEQAMVSYDLALARFEAAAAADPARRDGIDRSVALVLAGRGRLRFQSGDDEGAVADLLASFERRPDAAGDRDALGFKPGETAQIVLARLRERKKDELAARLQAALGRLDQELLRPDRE